MQHVMTETNVTSSLSAICLFEDDYVWEGAEEKNQILNLK